jgi:hypothetical protein
LRRLVPMGGAWKPLKFVRYLECFLWVRAALRREHRAGDRGEVPELGQYGECMAMATHVLLFFR